MTGAAMACSRRRGRRLPQFDRVAFRIVEAGEPAGGGVVPLGASLAGDLRGAQRRQHRIQIPHPQVEHPLLVRREVVGVRRDRREHHRAALDQQGPLIGRSGAFDCATGADAEMLAVPGRQRIRIVRPEEQAPYPEYRHVQSRQMS
jgi:hypothetical protein